ncbi:MAG: hypothetical protein CVV33_00125 [Methanomicrobiales archaeon HGW-Methanomicrobiales-4]|nr:MAG: hypothetical protein CVV33_00125 [Methanomicrobiales archaeon HGW-Methanomicrobiales-4]
MKGVDEDGRDWESENHITSRHRYLLYRKDTVIIVLTNGSYCGSGYIRKKNITTIHAYQKMMERSISKMEIMECIQKGMVIRRYEDTNHFLRF